MFQILSGEVAAPEPTVEDGGRKVETTFGMPGSGGDTGPAFSNTSGASQGERKVEDTFGMPSQSSQSNNPPVQLSSITDPTMGLANKNAKGFNATGGFGSDDFFGANAPQPGNGSYSGNNNETPTTYDSAKFENRKGTI